MCDVNLVSCRPVGWVKPNKKSLLFSKLFFLNGRDDTIRTCDPFVPSEVRYQAALHPDCYLIGEVHVNVILNKVKNQALRCYLLVI